MVSRRVWDFVFDRRVPYQIVGARSQAPLLAIIFFIAACTSTPPTAEPKVRVGATASTLMIARTITNRALTRATPFEIVIVSSNSALLAEAAQEKIQVGLTLALPENSILWATPISEETLVLIAHPTQTTLNLTLAQVLDIYEGRNNTWVAAAREDGDDSRLVFDTKVLRGVKPSLNTALAPSPEAMLKFVANNPKALGYVPSSWLNDSVKALTVEGKRHTDTNYLLRVLVVAIAKQEPQGRTREWLSEAQNKK